MLLLLLPTLFLFNANDAIAPPSLHPEGRIAAGSPVDITEIPYQVAVLFDYWDDGIGKLYCGGSIISPDVVLTAAHCTDRITADKLRIRAGSSRHNSGGQLVPVARFTKHPSYDPYKVNFDLSLLHLVYSLGLGPSVALAALPPKDLSLPDGYTAIISGLGFTGPYPNTRPETLRKALVPVMNHDQCAGAYMALENITITDNMFCSSPGDGSFCSSDSGGPLTADGVLFGVISWSIECGHPDYPSVYAVVSPFVDWIGDNL